MASSAGAASPADPFAELVTWKFVGAAVWHTGTFALGAALWHLAAAPGSQLPRRALSPAGVLAAAALYATSLLVLAAQRRLLSSTDVPPVHAPRLGLHGRGWPSLLAARCCLRGRTARAALEALALYAACALSGAVGVRGLAGGGKGGGSPSWLLWYGVALGLAYAVGYLVRAKNVLSYPIVQRPRYYRVKQRLRAAARSAVALPTAALAAALAAPALLPPSWRGGGPPPLPGLAAAAAAWRAGALCAFVWTMAAHVLEVVFTEPVAFGGEGAPDATRALLAALRHPDPLIQDWALADLAAVAEGAPGAAARLASVFSDETGATGWVPLVRLCLQEVGDLNAVLSAGRAAPPAAGGAGGGAAGVRWNAALRPGGGGGGGAAAAPRREEVLAEWHARSRFYRAAWCLRALSGLAAASLSRDSFGVAQLSSPGLGDAAVGLLSAVAVLTAHVKAAAAASALRRPPPAAPPPLAPLLRLAGGGAAAAAPRAGLSAAAVDPAAAALLDVAKTAAYRVTTTFGPVLRGPVREAAAAAAKAGAAGAAGAVEVLEGLLKLEE
ncbi:hypothetical protein Rsub_05524 [Raphidocelis subcapitata]|uniref:Nucleoporin protein Ndc1-Nup n=1 Tax=Raphidocelis subcapitata TaxID=307507 RepID=A0A2V0P072_9CHLO|nr:hypothetical protein Rsub_05524 [Raphidocelis subcapitata]|eukprot:GBF92322.1 hypothetical protein Rsub_05524 [Raphidocelis subcapitata]